MIIYFYICKGLRGAVAFVLALEFIQDDESGDDYWVATTIATIFFTVFFLGGTTALLVKVLGIKEEGEKMVIFYFLFLYLKYLQVLLYSIILKFHQHILKFSPSGTESMRVFYFYFVGKMFINDFTIDGLHLYLSVLELWMNLLSMMVL